MKRGDNSITKAFKVVFPMDANRNKNVTDYDLSKSFNGRNQEDGMEM